MHADEAPVREEHQMTTAVRQQLTGLAKDAEAQVEKAEATLRAARSAVEFSRENHAAILRALHALDDREPETPTQVDAERPRPGIAWRTDPPRTTTGPLYQP